MTMQNEHTLLISHVHLAYLSGQDEYRVEGEFLERSYPFSLAFVREGQKCGNCMGRNAYIQKRQQLLCRVIYARRVHTGRKNVGCHLQHKGMQHGL